MHDILIDLGNNAKLYRNNELVLEDKTINMDSITYQDIKKLLKTIKKRVFNSRIKLMVLNKENINLPRRIKVYNKQELTLLKNNIDINKSSATTIIYLDDNLINISVYALGKMIFTKAINKRSKNNIKKIIESFNEEVLSSIKEKGIILTGNISLDNMYKELRKELSIPIFKVDNYINIKN